MPIHCRTGLMAASEGSWWIWGWIWTYIQHLNLCFPRSVPQLLQAFRSPNGKDMYFAMVTSTYYWRFVLQKYTLLNEGLVPCNEKWVWRWTVWVVVKIKSFCEVVDEHPFLISTKADISPVPNMLLRFLLLHRTYCLHAWFQHFGPAICPCSCDFGYPRVWCKFLFYWRFHAYIVPDSSPNITMFSPLSVNWIHRGITPLPSWVSFQFLLHMDINVPWRSSINDSDIHNSRQVIHTVLFQMKDLNFASVTGQRKHRLVPVIIHRFHRLVERQDTSMRQLLEIVLFDWVYFPASNLL